MDGTADEPTSVRAFRCGKCEQVFTNDQSGGGACPHCGARVVLGVNTATLDAISEDQIRDPVADDRTVTREDQAAITTDEDPTRPEAMRTPTDDFAAITSDEESTRSQNLALEALASTVEGSEVIPAPPPLRWRCPYCASEFTGDPPDACPACRHSLDD